ncbi:hypothetical protein GCM10010913_19700 [Paenibacillus aceti]|uniref:Uncharacterized protein n=1 Tax=Paenibacillus aceti TaxID=1820010 RepID=A0ABQ1VTH8_9BACL|nr:hypothetical protein GCM10010913_19700 [Paenibacillus aceti]
MSELSACAKYNKDVKRIEKKQAQELKFPGLLFCYMSGLGGLELDPGDKAVGLIRVDA